MTCGPERMLARIRPRLSRRFSRKVAPRLSAWILPSCPASAKPIYPVSYVPARTLALPAEHAAQGRNRWRDLPPRFCRQPGSRPAFFYSREDRARFAGMDSALRHESCPRRLADKFDQQILGGTNAACCIRHESLANHTVSAP